MVDGTYNPGVGVETGSSLVLIATASLHDKLQASETPVRKTGVSGMASRLLSGFYKHVQYVYAHLYTCSFTYMNMCTYIHI